MQPAQLHGVSIALVNSLGNGVGGFVGPFLLGAAHDALSPVTACGAAPESTSGGCTAQWGVGTVLLGASALASTAACASALHKSCGGLRHHGHDHGDGHGAGRRATTSPLPPRPGRNAADVEGTRLDLIRRC